jgi:hypothetical protein
VTKEALLTRWAKHPGGTANIVACQPITRAAFCCVPGDSQEIESILQRLSDLFPYSLALCPTAHISFQARLNQVYLSPPDYPGHLRRCPTRKRQCL